MGGSDWACPGDYLVKAPERGCSLDQGRAWFVVVIFALSASPIWLWLLEIPAAPLHHYAPVFPPTLRQSVHTSGKKPKFFRTTVALCLPRTSVVAVAPCEQGSPLPLLSWVELLWLNQGQNILLLNTSRCLSPCVRVPVTLMACDNKVCGQFTVHWPLANVWCCFALIRTYYLWSSKRQQPIQKFCVCWNQRDFLVALFGVGFLCFICTVTCFSLPASLSSTGRVWFWLTSASKQFRLVKEMPLLITEEGEFSYIPSWSANVCFGGLIGDLSHPLPLLPMSLDHFWVHFSVKENRPFCLICFIEAFSSFSGT